VVLRFSPVFFPIGVYFVVSQSWCGVSRLLVEFLRVVLWEGTPQTSWDLLLLFMWLQVQLCVERM
jgi:hypothetical protein